MAQSEFRPGRSLCALGGPGSVAIAAGANNQFTLQVREAGQLGQLCVQGYDVTNSAAGTSELTVTEITHNNDLLISTTVSADLFENTSLISPLFGHIVQVNDELTVTVANTSAANAYTASVSFSTI